MNVLLTFPLLAGALAFQDSVAPVRSVPAIDLTRYMGLWYEIAKLPNRFQARCRSETTARYTLLPGDVIRVVNACKDENGAVVEAEGRARLARRGGPTSQLKVRFAPSFLSWLPMVWGDYWVLDITEDYGAALVGEPSRKYLWILARTPQIDEATYARLVATAAAQGFDVTRLSR